MQKWIVILWAVIMIAGCSTNPAAPKPHPLNYTIQVIDIEIPAAAAEKFVQLKGDSESIPSENAENIINHPDAVIRNYPLVIAGLGETVTNDQSESVSMAEDYHLVEGKAVAKDKIYKLGDCVSVTINKIENGFIYYDIKASHQELAGFDEYKLASGESVKIPALKARKLDTSIAQKPNSWDVIGGLTAQQSNGEERALIICLRAIPPAISE